jgi:chromosome segregation ATPase
MKDEVSAMKNFKGCRVGLLILGFIVAGFYGSVYRIKAGTEAARAQDTFSLERRISSLEQRLNSIELSINRLEQQSAASTRAAPSTNQREIELDLLQAQIRTLQGQLNEIGCGLAKLDERTTSASVREAQKRAGKLNTDPCRLNPETPLRLSTRQ